MHTKNIVQNNIDWSYNKQYASGCTKKTLRLEEPSSTDISNCDYHVSSSLPKYRINTICG